MAYTYMVEPLLAVIPLNFILTVYLHAVYIRRPSANPRFVRMNDAVAAGVLADVLLCAAVSGMIEMSAGALLFAVYLRQTILAFIMAASIEYMAVEEDSVRGRILKFARRGLLVFFFYAALVLFFTRHNAHIEDGQVNLAHGRLIFSLILPVMFIAMAGVTFYLQRDLLRKEQRRIFSVMIVLFFVVHPLRFFFLPGLLADSITMTCALYLFFFALETPSYAQVERALDRLTGARAEAEEAEKEAGRADEEMGTFLANISHEIRTPLTTILGMNEMILRKHPAGAIHTRALDIESAGQSLVHIINDILDFSRIESGELELMTRPYHLGQVLRDIDNMISIRAREKGLEYLTEIDRSLPDELVGDRIRIQQVMVNLLNNGVKYTRRGQVKLSLTGVRSSDPSYITLRIIVSDTGIGIREEDMEKLFKNFTRIDPEQTHGIEGTGLGLAITGRLIELMDGKVNVQSVYGEGTTFTVLLPQRVAGSATLRDFEKTDKKEEAQTQDIFLAPGRRVLIVDDNQMNRIVLQALLKETQVEITQASGGEEALALCRDNHFDLILMDYMMPVMDGKETLQRLRADKDAASCDTPVVVCTANAVAGIRAELFAAGFDEYLSKPVDSADLTRVLRRFLGEEKEEKTT